MSTTTATSEESSVTAEHLQMCMGTLIDLQLQAKQVHWNVRGSGFLSFHRFLDELYQAIGEQIDTLAERIVTLGRHADGTIGTISETTKLKSLKPGRMSVAKGVDIVVDRLVVSTKLLRESIDQIQELDEVSKDILSPMIADLEKFRWLTESQVE
ncbi:MAG: DNA starvation/stationary phase protection protein [Pirellulales bacterium]